MFDKYEVFNLFRLLENEILEMVSEKDAKANIISVKLKFSKLKSKKLFTKS